MQYMSEKYHMDAFCICREQLAVDAYTLWGGYYSGGYYPSKNNMLCPAQNDENRIATPVFRMLGIDPIYGYDENKDSENHPRLNGCFTMEPYWDCGKDREVMEWYFREYYENPSLAGSHATTGQENSFGWEGIADGYRLQLELAQKWMSEGKLTVETLGETGRRFRKAFRDTPPAALSALTDWSGNGIRSVWFSCRYWRGNLFLRDGVLFFRDLVRFRRPLPRAVSGNALHGMERDLRQPAGTGPPPLHHAGEELCVELCRNGRQHLACTGRSCRHADRNGFRGRRSHLDSDLQ